MSIPEGIHVMTEWVYQRYTNEGMECMTEGIGITTYINTLRMNND